MSAGARLRVIVADDHPMWREAVSRDLEQAGFEVVATAYDGPGAAARTIALRPDVLVLDLNLPGSSGVDVCRAVTRARVPTRILILSASGEHADVLEAVKEGAAGYLLKSASREDFLAAVSDTAAGKAVFTPGLAGLLLGEFRRISREPEPDAPALTARETQILKLVATGRNSRVIAEQLGISHRTVQNHVQNILGKLQLHNRVELVRYAIAAGLDEPSAPGP